MKKLLCLLLVCFSLPLFAQQYDTVDLGDEVYSFILIAEQKGYCSHLSNVKPYTQKYIMLYKINEIIHLIK